MRIYVCGPLSSPDPVLRMQHVEAAVDAGIALYQRGHVPYIPHLSHYVDLRQIETGAGLVYEDWLRVDLAWLRCCDALLYLGSSPGADREMAFAVEHAVAVFRSLDEVPDLRTGTVRPVPAAVEVTP